MKIAKYKLLSVLIFLITSVQAQTFDKKISENFKVKSDVNVVINATHTDVDITTWDKNEVRIQAVMEVEGVSKKEAAKIFKKWKFEALGNSDKVKISSYSGQMSFDFNGEFAFDFDFDFPDIEILEFDMPDIEIPEIDFPEIEFPEMVFPEIEIPELELKELHFDYQAYKADSTYLKKYKNQAAYQIERMKNSDWKKKIDSIRNSDAYKKNMEAYRKASKEIAEKMKEFHKSEEYKKAMAETKKAMAETKRAMAEVKKEMLKNKELMEAQKKAAKKASVQTREIIAKMKAEGVFDSIKRHSQNVYFNSTDSKNSKIKIKIYLKIKVPKKATFDLNVRHGKLNVPNSNTKMSAILSHGNFVGGIIEGLKNELKISNSPVLITMLSSGNVTLKNVPNAQFGTFEKANLFANSSVVIIDEVGVDVSLSQRFGNLIIRNVGANFRTLNVIVDSAKADLNCSSSDFMYTMNSKNSSLKLFDGLNELSNKTSEGVKVMEGYNLNKSSKNNLLLTGVFSTIVLN